MAEDAPQPPQQPTAHGKRSGAARRKLRKERQAQLDAQFANLQIGSDQLPRLPPELQLKVIQAGAERSEPLGPSSPESRNRRAFLRRASLVCSLWRSEAQRLLWIAPHFETNEAMQSFLRTNKTTWPTLELNISTRIPCLSLDLEQIRRQASRILEGDLTREVIERCKGVRSLCLGEVVMLSPLVFQSSALSDLRHLQLLETVRFDHRFTSLPSTYPFSLSSVHIGLAFPIQIPGLSTSFVISLLGASPHSASLESMDMSSLMSQLPPPRGAFPRPKKALPSSHLSLIFSLDVDTVTPLLPVLRAFNSLQTFTSNQSYGPVFAALPKPIRELRLGHFGQRINGTRNGNEVVTLLRAGHRSLSQLERLTILDSSASEEGSESLKRECRARGIELRWERAT